MQDLYIYLTLFGLTGIGWLIKSGLIIAVTGLGMFIFGCTLWNTLAWQSALTAVVGLLMIVKGLTTK